MTKMQAKKKKVKRERKKPAKHRKHPQKRDLDPHDRRECDEMNEHGFDPHDQDHDSPPKTALPA
jgi:hypothetical protein